MAHFRYSGRNSEGGKVNGVLEAATADAAATALFDRGVMPTDIIETKPAKNQSSDSGDSWQDRYFKQKVTIDDMIMLSRQLFSLTRAGVAINRAIHGLGVSTRNTTLKEALLDIERSLNAGVALAPSMRRHSDIFDHLYVSIVHVGENSGRMEGSFEQLAGYLEREKDTQQRISTALRYPSFVVAALAVAMVILNLKVIPVFADLFAQFDAELPWATKILIGTSNIFVNYWYLLIGGVVALVFAVHQTLQTRGGRLYWDEKKLRLPIVGDIFERSLLSRFSRSFAMMTQSGVPLIQTIDLCAQAVGNTYLAEKVVEMRAGIERGETLFRVCGASGMFSPLVMQMVAVGEETGRVDELLLEVADFYDREVDYDLKSLSSKIEPILIVGLGAIVGVLALGIFLPMWDMMSAAQGK